MPSDLEKAVNQADAYGNLLVNLYHTAVEMQLPQSEMGGMSINMATGLREVRRDGYFVSLDGGLKLNYPIVTGNWAQPIMLDGCMSYALFQWLEMCEAKGMFAAGRYLGTWLDTKTQTLHVDISVWFGSEERKSALKFAKQNKQIAVWDVAKECEIRV